MVLTITVIFTFLVIILMMPALASNSLIKDRTKHRDGEFREQQGLTSVVFTEGDRKARNQEDPKGGECLRAGARIVSG